MTENSKPSWKKLNEKQIVKVLAGENKEVIFVIVPRNYKKITIPLFCPLCGFPMKTKEDGIHYRKEKLCEKCSYKWAHKRDVLANPTFFQSDEWIDYIHYITKLARIKINLK